MPFMNDSQRKAVMAKLREQGFAQKPHKITAEGQFIRARMRNPNQFQKGSFRTIKASKTTRLIIARPKGVTKTRLQAVLIKNVK